MKHWTWLLTLVLSLSVTEFVKADETITVSSTSSDIAAGLDLKAVAKIFASAQNLEEFETLLNNPDSSYVNLDLNGDGDIDYIRVVETGSGNNHLIVLQAILAKDIFQDVASIKVVKDEAQNIKVTITGDERIYGKDYVITPVYIYRPVIYDWFWGPDWYCWNSPYYWGYWPGWWHPVAVWGGAWYAQHIYTYHHAHPYCSYRYSQSARPTSRVAGPAVASATAAPRTRYAEQSAYVPNRTATSVSRVPQSTTGSSTTSGTARTQTSARYANYTNSTRSTNTTTSARTAAHNQNTYTNQTRSSNYSSTPSSYSGSRSAGGYSGGGYSGSARSAGGYSGQSVRR